VPGASEEPVQEGGSRSAFAQARMPSGSGSLDREGRDSSAGVGAASGPHGRGSSRPAIGVLADRIAASLVHHEPGWRLPRHTALARRYNVSTAEIDAAVNELSTRHLVRRLPDGQLYRVSPAEYLIPIEGVPGLGAYADPMGGQIDCRSRQASWRQVPEDIGWALRIPPADPVGVIRVQWTAGGEPAAFCTTYLLKEMAGPFINAQGGAGPGGLSLLPITAPALPDPDHGEFVAVGEPRAVHVEMQPPPPSVARSLRLSAGQPAALVTVRFDDPEEDRPVALTIAVFRPDLFRIVVESGGQLVADGGVSRAGGPGEPGGSAAPSGASREGTFSAAWTHAVED
jgi:DNA-binding GntR family transcriptional regulator